MRIHEKSRANIQVSHLNFLDNLDDPNFNPFGSKTVVSNSPPKSGIKVDNCNNNLDGDNNNKSISVEDINNKNILKSEAEPRQNYSEVDNKLNSQIENKIVNSREQNSNEKEQISNSNQSKEVIEESEKQSDSQINRQEFVNKERPKTGGSTSLNRVPSFGGISVSLLESSQFDQLLGNEASRLAEELSKESSQTGELRAI